MCIIILAITTSRRNLEPDDESTDESGWNCSLTCVYNKQFYIIIIVGDAFGPVSMELYERIKKEHDGVNNNS